MIGYRGQQVLGLIRASVEHDGTVPSYQDIANRLDMSRSDVCNVIRRLEHRGYLRRRDVGYRKKRGWHKPVIVLTQTTPTT